MRPFAPSSHTQATKGRRRWPPSPSSCDRASPLVSVSVIKLIDRRDSASTETQEWVFQREVEAALYGNGYSQQTGAVYRLLQRSGVGSRSLPLKKACIQQGLVTQDEFD